MTSHFFLVDTASLCEQHADLAILIDTIRPFLAGTVTEDEYHTQCDALRFSKKNAGDLNRLSDLPPQENNYIRIYDGRVSLECPWQNVSIAATFERDNIRSRIRPNAVHKEFVVRSIVGRKKSAVPLRVIDLTAGLGVDSLLLAAAGCDVLAFESNPLVAFFLQASLLDAKNSSNSDLQAAAGRIRLVAENSIAALDKEADKADVAYLDPMFFNHQKKAASKKGMAFLQSLLTTVTDTAPQIAVNQQDNETGLWLAAKRVARQRIVVKRALKSAYLCEQKPASSLLGKAARFDIYPR